MSQRYLLAPPILVVPFIMSASLWFGLVAVVSLALVAGRAWTVMWAAAAWSVACAPILVAVNLDSGLDNIAVGSSMCMALALVNLLLQVRDGAGPEQR